MASGIQQHIPEDIASRLERAWEFLSGQKTMFDAIPAGGLFPSFSEFSIYMPWRMVATRTVAGIGVLMDREQALCAASHMFDVPRDALLEDDLRDACCETCNVFSDCVSAHLGGDADLVIGLPHRVDRDAFAQLACGSAVAFGYQGVQPQGTLTVLIYNVLQTPWMQ